MGTDDVMQTVPITEQLGNIPTLASQKIMNMLFIVDTSGSMKRRRIQEVNKAFHTMIPKLQEVQRDVNAEFELRIAIMSFNQVAQWIVPPTPILEYNHSDIQCSDFVTFYSEAFKALSSKLTRNEFMSHQGKIAAPYIMFMTDGKPTPDDPYKEALEELKQNGWFLHSQRFAVLIGDDVINDYDARKAVSNFVNDEREGIVSVSDAEQIAGEVEAKTMRTVIDMTQHPVGDVRMESENNTQDGAFGDFSSDFDDGDFFDNNMFI